MLIFPARILYKLSYFFLLYNVVDVGHRKVTAVVDLKVNYKVVWFTVLWSVLLQSIPVQSPPAHS